MFSEFAMKKNSERLSTVKRAAYRNMMAKAQGSIDWITGARLRKPMIDHDHDTGHCRLILNANTNTFEGRLNALLSATLERHQWSAALFDCHSEVYASVVDLIYEFWPYQANDEFIRRVSLRFGVYYAAVWEEMGHLKYGS